MGRDVRERTAEIAARQEGRTAGRQEFKAGRQEGRNSRREGIVWFNGGARSLPTPGRATPIQPPAVAAAPRTIHPASYDAYVRGRHALDKRGESDLHEAVRFFQDSIDADPTYASAYAGMADSYGQLGYGSYTSPEDAFPRARAAARKAIELDRRWPRRTRRLALR